jgi:hypothetical protein
MTKHTLTNVELIGLNNLVSADLQALQKEAEKALKSAEQLAAEDTDVNKKDLLSRTDDLLVKDQKDTEAALTRFIKQMQPLLRKFSLNQRKIRITHAVVKDSNDPKSPLLLDDKGNFQYSIEGQINVEIDLDALNYTVVEFETDLDVDSPIVSEYSYLKDFIEGKLF